MFRKMCSMLVCMVCLCTVFSAYGEERGNHQVYEQVEKVLEVRNSYSHDEEENLVISKHVSGNSGPKDFAVINKNDILILDASQTSMKRYVDGHYLKTYVFRETDYYEFLATDGVYAYVIGWEKLLRVHLDSGREDVFPYPASLAQHVPSPVWENDTLVLQEWSCGNHIFDSHTGRIEKSDLGFHVEGKRENSQDLCRISYAKSTWEFNAEDRSNQAVGVDDDGNLLVYVTDFSRKTEKISRIHRIDPTGNILSSVCIDYSNHLSLAHGTVKLHSDNKIYVMCVYEPYTAIYVIPEKGDYCIAEPAIPVPEEAEAPLIEGMDYDQESGSRGSISNDLIPMPAGRTRQAVLTSANTMKNLQWTLREHNMHWQWVDDVYTMPKYLEGKSAGSLITSIPYAWNKMNGIVYDEAHGLYKFADCVGQSQNVTGNVSSSNLTTPTIGLDCSAFVSSAYGLHNKVNTARFYSDPMANTWYPEISWSSLQSMDMAVKNGHVLLFNGWQSYNYSFNTIECRAANDGSSNDGKVLSRLVYVGDLQNLGYKCRTSANWTCTHASAVYYDYSFYSHKKVCSSCGGQWLQTHTTYNGGPCVLCGRINCASPRSGHNHDDSK